MADRRRRPLRAEPIRHVGTRRFGVAGPLVRRVRRLGCALLAVAPLLAGVLAAPATLAPAPAQAQDALRIVAVVNDEPISLHDLATRMNLLIVTSNMAEGAETRQRLANHVLRLLIEERLKLQEARRLNISVTREELEGALVQIAGQVGISPEALPRMLANRGTNIQALIEQVEAEIAWVKTVQARTREDLSVSDDEVEARLEQLASDAGQPEVRVAEIFLPIPSPGQEAEIEALMQRLVQQLAQGASFRSLARNFSQGATAAAGGDLGWARLEQFDPDLREIVADLPTGQAYGPVRTPLGYYILFMIERREIQAPEGEVDMVRLHRLARPLSRNANDAEVRATMQRLAEMARGAATCEALAGAAASDSAILSGDMGAMEFRRLDPELQKIIGPLSAGDKTPPLLAQDGAFLFMVCERGRQDVSERLRERVRESILQERVATASRRLLRELQREAFVDVRI